MVTRLPLRRPGCRISLLRILVRPHNLLDSSRIMATRRQRQLRLNNPYLSTTRKNTITRQPSLLRRLTNSNTIYTSHTSAWQKISKHSNPPKHPTSR